MTILFLFYPITLEGRRGSTDEFATIPSHLDLFSAALVELAKSIPVHSLILSSHLFFCLPLFRDHVILILHYSRNSLVKRKCAQKDDSYGIKHHASVVRTKTTSLK